MPPELFAALAATWPAAETARAGGFTVRRGSGGGNRTSSATRDADGTDIAAAEAAMRAWGQRPIFQIRTGEADLDAELAARGYRRGDDSVVYAVPAAALAKAGGLDAIPCDGPLATMAALWAEGGVGPERLAVMARAPAPRTWLLGRLDDRPVGAAFVAGHAGVAMLSALHVAPAARRRGLAAHVVRAAAAWAESQDLPTFALAVTADNTPARALYLRLGMAEAARYHYRSAPEDSA